MLLLAAAGPPGVRVDPAAARAAARDILDADRFQAGAQRHESLVTSVVTAIGDGLERLLRALDDGLPGGTGVAWAALGALVLLLAAVAGARALQRPPAAAAWAATGSGRRAEADPAALERDADRAERDGDHGRAVRLRFAAGLLRLDAAGAIALRPSTTTGQVRRALGSPDLDGLVATFEEVAYGGRAAGAPDAAAAREGWPRVVAAARRAAPGAAPAGAPA